MKTFQLQQLTSMLAEYYTHTNKSTLSPSLMLVSITIVVIRSSQITDQKSTTDTFRGARVCNMVPSLDSQTKYHKPCAAMNRFLFL